jgi:transposase
MGQILHGSATTTYAVRAALQRSQASVTELAERYGLNEKTVRKWRKRSTVEDARMGPREVRSSVLSPEHEAMCVAFRRHTLLPLDDCVYALQASIPHLSRSALHRLFQRHGISRPSDRFALQHIFDRGCGENSIEHRKTKVNHPWTNGQVERMNRTIKEATVRRYHYANRDQLRTHLDDFIAAYNYARRLKTLRGLTPYEHIVKCWTEKPESFRINPTHNMPGPNT